MGFQKWEIVAVSIAVACAITCVVMSIVFAYNVALVYPSAYVNVVRENATMYEFYMRCDLANDGRRRLELQEACGVSLFIIEPACAIPWHSYYYGTYGFGKMPCLTNYLHAFTRTENLNINLVALASLMMALGAAAFTVAAVFFIIND